MTDETNTTAPVAPATEETAVPVEETATEPTPATEEASA